MTASRSTRRKRALLVGTLTAIIFGTIPFLTGSYAAAGVVGAGLFLGMSAFYSRLDAKRPT